MICKSCVRRKQGYNNCLLDSNGFCKRYRSESADIIAANVAKMKLQTLTLAPRVEAPAPVHNPFAFMQGN